MQKRALASLLFFGLACAAAHAALPAQEDRVVQPVNPDQRVALSERRAAWISPANDVGAVPADLPLTGLSITLTRSTARQQAFDQLLKDQQDPTSPDYHHWLSATEIGERFGATQHDIDVVSGWLRSQGLNVDAVSNSRTRIRFNGSAAAVSRAFATAMRFYNAGADKRIANASDAQIPAAFAAAVASVRGLTAVRYQPALHTSAPIQAAASMQPAATYCPQGSTSCVYNVFPADFAAIYDLNPLYSQGIKGNGQTIAIVGRSRVYQRDIDEYQSLASLPSSTPTTIIPPAGTDPGPALTTCPDSTQPGCGNPADQVGDQTEATLDVQRANGTAPAATIKLVVSGQTNSVDGVDIATDYVIDTDPVPAKILSISFLSCEADNGRTVAEGLEQYFSQAAAEGISVFVASGDAGVAGCASLDQAPQPGEPVSTNVLCSSQYVTCVGGTEFADAQNPTQYWRSTNGAGFLSALGYIPEGAWNEPLNGSGHPQLAATGGGVSAYIPRPSWQTGTGVPGNAGRYTPDVSLHASTSEGYFTCAAAQGGSCVASQGSFTFIAGGGTSASTPSMAGIAALLNQKMGAAQGNLNPRLYQLAANTSAAAFHDVTVASSHVSGCTLAVPSMCNNSTPGTSGLTGGLAGFMVGTGYDEATGLGSVDATNLVTHWGGSSSSLNLDQAGLGGSWYDPSEGGQGIVMQVMPDFYGTGQGLLFGGWFTFDVTAAGGQRWYSVQGTVTSASSATMPIYKSEGGNFDALPAVGVTQVGQATFAFSDCSNGTLTYAFTDGSGRNGSIPLSRLGNNVACVPGGDSTPPGSYYLSGTWYDPTTAGQGFVFDIDPVAHTLFAAWYTYATNGQQIGGPASERWYTLQSSFTPGSGHVSNVPIYQTNGGVFDQSTSVTTAPVGTANITYHNCNSATLTYTFSAGANAGHSGSIDLARVAPASSSCTL
jgi:pseudomonalisin